MRNRLQLLPLGLILLLPTVFDIALRCVFGTVSKVVDGDTRIHSNPECLKKMQCQSIIMRSEGKQAGRPVLRMQVRRLCWHNADRFVTPWSAAA